MMVLLLLWMSAVSVALGGSPPQHWLLKTWETEDGLPENSATAMVQTPDGYLWFGTFNGLVRFDGIKFTVLTPENTPGLPGDGVVNLHLDRENRLWVSTLQGLAVCEQSSWRRIQITSTNAAGAVRTFAERAQGGLLLTLFGGGILEYTDGKLVPLPNPPGVPDQGYWGVADSEGAWWVIQGGLSFRWDGREWKPIASLPAVASDAAGCAPALDGGHWILRGRELVKYHGTTIVERRELSEPPGGIWSLSEDSWGSIWVCTFDRGVCQVAPSGLVRRWTEPSALAYKGTRFAFEDRERNLWIGTSGGGLTRFKPRRLRAFGPESGLTERVIKSVCPDPKQGVWVASYGQGLFFLDDTGAHSVDWPGRPPGRSYLQSVLMDRSGRLWVGTFDEGFLVRENGVFRSLIPGLKAGANGIALFEDRRGRIWLSGGKGVGCYENGSLREFGIAEGLPEGGVRCFAEDSSGRVWVSNLSGLFRFEGDRFEEIKTLMGDPIRQITALKAEPDGALWLGSLTDGLGLWRAGRIFLLGPAEGLPVSSVHGIVEDRDQVFWLASNRGVVRVKRQDLEARCEGRSTELPCQLLDLSDGLIGVECARGQQPTCSQDPAGRIWFATSKGVAMTDPAEFRLNRVPPQTQIESVAYESGVDKQVHQFGIEVDSSHRFGDAHRVPELRLPVGSRSVEIQFSAPSFTAPEKVRFQFRLEGEDLVWREVGRRRVAYFENLKPGRHLFRVRAANDDGVWDDVGAALSLEVPPQFWQTRWFQGLVGAAVVLEAALIAGLVISQRRHKIAAAELQRQRAELAHVSRVVTVGELTSSLAHELNHPQSAILSNAQAGELFLSADPPALDEVRKILADIVRDNRRSGEIIQRLRAFLKKRELEFEAVDLPGLLRDIIPLVEADAAARNVVLTLSGPTTLPSAKADRVHLQQVLLNLVLNALEALTQVPPEKREIRLGARVTSNGLLEVSVWDSGPGIPPDQLHRVFEPFFTTKPQGIGIGLSIARTLLEAHRGQIWAENDPAGGAVIRFTLQPADPSHE